MTNIDTTIPQPRKLGAVNWLGLWTLTSKEIRRFLKVYFQTIIAPMVTTLMFLAIFSLSVGSATVTVGAVPFAQFLAPGLIIMAMTQNAFANTSSSLIIAKVQGNIVDVLMPPLSALEQTLGFALGGVARGVVVGLAVGISMIPFAPVSIQSFGFVVFHGVMASLMLSLLGMIAGIWADKFDHMAAVTNFIVTPLSFLSGTFYSVARMPEPFRTASRFNPLFYLIDGFRYGFIGRSEQPLALGAGFVLILAVVLGLTVWRLFAVGYRLKT